MNVVVSPKKSLWRSKAIVLGTLFSALFMVLFYLAITNEPDYMPSQKRLATNQTAFKNAPVMSKEALAAAEQDRADAKMRNNMKMSDQQMQHNTHPE